MVGQTCHHEYQVIYTSSKSHWSTLWLNAGFGSNTPTKRNITMKTSKFSPITFTEGKAKINGTGCTGGGGGGGGDDLTVTAPTLVTPPNVQLCIPIKVDNFINIDGAQSKIKWDPTVLTLVQPLKYDALPGNFYNWSNIGVVYLILYGSILEQISYHSKWRKALYGTLF